MAKSGLRPPGDPLLGHVLEIERRVPLKGGLSGIFREVGTTRDGSRTVDGRQQGQIPARIVYRVAPEGDRVEVVVEPEAVVHHPTKKGRLVGPARAGESTHPAAVFATRVEREGKSRLGQSLAVHFVVVPFVLDAIIRVNSILVAYRIGRAAGHRIGEVVLAHAIIV